MKESKKKQQPDSFLSQELIDESQIQIPIGYEIVNKYPLLPPFSYVNILYNTEKSSYLYFVDEVRLNAQEKQH
jgi:archaeal flagellar protein FlaI